MTSFHEEYKNFLSDVISNGYTKEVLQHQFEAPTGRVWYIPHHGTIHVRESDEWSLTVEQSTKGSHSTVRSCKDRTSPAR